MAQILMAAKCSNEHAMDTPDFVLITMTPDQAQLMLRRFDLAATLLKENKGFRGITFDAPFYTWFKNFHDSADIAEEGETPAEGEITDLQYTTWVEWVDTLENGLPVLITDPAQFVTVPSAEEVSIDGPIYKIDPYGKDVSFNCLDNSTELEYWTPDIKRHVIEQITALSE